MPRSDADCPLCDRGFDAQADLRVHLLTSHRKSAVVDELLTSGEEGQVPRSAP